MQSLLRALKLLVRVELESPTLRHTDCVEVWQRLVESMNNAEVDVVAYPTWSNPPRLIGDTASPDGNNSPTIAPHTGAPAISVPMGFTKAGTLHLWDSVACAMNIMSPQGIASSYSGTALVHTFIDKHCCSCSNIVMAGLPRGMTGKREAT